MIANPANATYAAMHTYRDATARHTGPMPAPRVHDYQVTVRWTGNRGTGTSDYRAYGRDHQVEAEGKEPILGSSDPEYRGDPARWNPEELLVSAVAQCHALWYLHLAAEAGVVVTDYVDAPIGTVDGTTDGAGQFREVVLYPTVTVAAPEMVAKARALHDEVGQKCTIARSVAFPVRHEPTIRAGEADQAR
jgi:organic hydroperoxide reductase OsmC/OhrA